MQIIIISNFVDSKRSIWIIILQKHLKKCNI